MTYNKFEKKQQQDRNLTLEKYFYMYPRNAGKIGYIYYRFDIADDVFVRSVKGGKEYLQNREDFAEKIANLYKNQYKADFDKAYNKGDNSINKNMLVENFINDIGKVLGIDKRYRPKIDFNPLSDNAGTYDRDTNTLSVDINSDLDGILDTIIHEYRHFYMYYLLEDNPLHNLSNNIFMQFIYNAIYVDWSYETIFNQFDKICSSFDEKMWQCYKGQLYIKNNGKSSPLYYIQPSERDCRVTAGLFMNKI